MHIIEAFQSIEGEGIRSGKLVTFIRLAGCNLRCSYCDTKYSYDIADATEMTAEEVVQKVKEFGCNLVTITGGEPLIHEDVNKLISQLTLDGYQVNIETNGSIPIRPFKKFNPELPIAQDKLMFTVDWKSPSSLMMSKMLTDNLFACGYRDVIKFVVGSKEDLNHMYDVISSNAFTCRNIYISPVWGNIEMSEIVDFMKEKKLYDCNLQIQLHKVVWDVNERGV